jgi:glycosyltransferase involved in cell wall biosynthesis
LILLIDQKSEDGAVLIIDHELGGGANIYRETIERELNQKNIPILVYSERSPRKTGRFSIIYKGNNILLSTGSRDDVLRLAKHIKISSIHYNNSVSFPEPEQIASFLVDLKKISSGQLILAMHDFFIACPSPHFFNHEGKFCEIPPIDQCKICLPQNSYAVTTEPVDIQVWRALWGKCLQETDKILCFSESTAKLLCKAYPAIAIEKIEVKPHQVNYVAKYKPQLYLGPQMHIGVAGIIGPHKGALIVEKMAQIIHQKNIQAKIFVFGAYFGQQEDSVITVVGKYKPEELPDLIEKVGVSVFLFPTVVPETFSYTTQELMHLEVPIVAFNLGAPADRLSRYPLGKLVDKVDAEEALNALIMLHKQCLIELPDRYSVH